jgi:ankyrin repeat protein
LVDDLHRYQQLEDLLPRLEEVARLLLDAGCDINAQDAHHQTALLLRLHHESGLVSLLLHRGADPNIAEDRGGTPMDFFHNHLQHPEWFTTLRVDGARLDVALHQDGRTPLHTFASKCQLGDLSSFRPFVSDWTATDAEGNTLLHLGVEKHRRGS